MNFVVVLARVIQWRSVPVDIGLVRIGDESAEVACVSDTVPVTLVDFNDQQSFEAALVENIQRSDLNPIEKAQGFKDYLDKFGLTQEQLDDACGDGTTKLPDGLVAPAGPARPRTGRPRTHLPASGCRRATARAPSGPGTPGEAETPH